MGVHLMLSLQVSEELLGLGLTPEAVDRVLHATHLTSLDDLEAMVGPSSAAVAELRQLFALADAYGFAEYLQFDASCVRGLAYYTGALAWGLSTAPEGTTVVLSLALVR